MTEPLLTPATTDADIARVQQAIGETVDRWAKDVEGEARYARPSGAYRGGDYEEHWAFAEASPVQERALQGRLADRLDKGR
jgi:hypothetical protein